MKHALIAIFTVIVLVFGTTAAFSATVDNDKPRTSYSQRAGAKPTRPTATVTAPGPTATVTVTAPGPTVTVTAPGPTKTVTATATVTVPGPTTTVTQTVTATPSSPTSTATSTPTSTPTTTTTPVPGNFPGPNDTGVPAGWTPTRTVNGNLNATTPGQVIEDVRIVNGSILVYAPNVTIRRVEIQGGIIHNEPQNGCNNGTVIEQVTIKRAPGQVTRGTDGPVVGVGGWSADRLKVEGVPEGVRVGGQSVGCGPVRLTNSYIQVQSPDVCGDWHGDALQGYDGNAVTVRNTTLLLNTLNGCGGTAPFFYPHSQGNTSVDIDGLFVGGNGAGYQFRNGMPGTVKNLAIQTGWEYGPIDVKCSVLSVWDARIVNADGSFVRTQPCNTENGN